MGTISFDQPPLIEVSFGVKFEPLAAFRAAHFGLLWAKLRPDFDEVADKGVVATAGAVPDVQGNSEWFPLPRVWYVHRDKQQLLQLQVDRFYMNWRRVQTATPYPRFTTLAPLFRRYYDKFSALLNEEGLGALNVEHTELTYVNQIDEGECWRGVQEIGKVFPDLAWRNHARPQGEPEGFAWTSKFASEFVELNASIKTQSVSGGLRRFILELRATSRNKPASLDDFLAWYPIANEIIVSTFVDLTSKALQTNVWKRTDN